MFKKPRLCNHSGFIHRPPGGQSAHSPHTLGPPRPAPAVFRFICLSFHRDSRPSSRPQASPSAHLQRLNRESCGAVSTQAVAPVILSLSSYFKKKLYVNYYWVYMCGHWRDMPQRACGGQGTTQWRLSSLFKWVLGMQQACMPSTSTHGAIPPAHLSS